MTSVLSDQDPLYILGAGPAGLVAAYTLIKQGQPVVVVDRCIKVGGLSKSINYQGFTLDCGSHFLATNTPGVGELFNEILRDEQVLLDPMTRFYWRRQYFSYPPQISEIFGRLKLLKSIQMIFSLAWARLLRQKTPHNHTETLASQHGTQLFENFLRGYVEKVWGVFCTELSANCVAGRANGVFQAILNQLITCFVQKEASPGYNGRISYPIF